MQRMVNLLGFMTLCPLVSCNSQLIYQRFQISIETSQRSHPTLPLPSFAPRISFYDKLPLTFPIFIASAPQCFFIFCPYTFTEMLSYHSPSMNSSVCLNVRSLYIQWQSLWDEISNYTT